MPRWPFLQRLLQVCLAGCDISPTLPFDIDASALQEACNTAPAVAEEPAMQTEEVCDTSDFGVRVVYS